MVDTELLRTLLRERGHTVGSIIPTPSNAGDYEFEVDGALLTLDEARLLAERDATTQPRV